jgi:two-component system, response regulator, stage 0 sporulation protein F
MMDTFSSRGSVLASERAHILLAEDDDEFRALLALVLAGDGYEVDQVPDGAAFMEKVGEWFDLGTPSDDCDLIISDVRMPGCSGLDVVSRLRQKGSQVPVILLTALPDDSTKRSAERLGATMFHKPFELDDLRTAVLNTLAYGPRARN